MVFNKKKLSPDEKLAKALPADILLISSKPDPDHIKEEDVFAGLAASALPPAGPAGVLTRELVAAWNKRELVSGTPESWKDTFEKVHLAMGHKSVNHLPQVSSNRKVAATDAAAIVPSKKEGKKRAVLVGIEYGGKLHGCHMAVREMADYLRSKHGFSQKDITVLMDDDKAFPPTRKSILSSIHDAAKQSDEGDTVVVLFVGHSGRILQEDGKIASETLLPVDAHKTAPIRDEDLFTKLMCAMPKGSHLTVIVDGCHGGEVADLPFLFRHKDPAGISRLHSGFEVDAVLGLAIGAAAVGVGTAVAMEAGGCCDDCCSIFFQEVVGVNLGND